MNNGIWANEALEILPLEYWRYSLIRNRPEKQDTSFLWSEFHKDILELNDIFGNFIHRTLTFTFRNWDAKVPTPTTLDAIDNQLLEEIKGISKKVGDLFDNFKLKAALEEIVSLVKKGNIYLNEKEPWNLIKNNKKAVEDFKKGKESAIQFLIGKAMAISQGKLKPQDIEKVIRRILAQ